MGYKGVTWQQKFWAELLITQQGKEISEVKRWKPGQKSKSSWHGG